MAKPLAFLVGHLPYSEGVYLLAVPLLSINAASIYFARDYLMGWDCDWVEFMMADDAGALRRKLQPGERVLMQEPINTPPTPALAN
jgi:hypothetical protein